MIDVRDEIEKRLRECLKQIRQELGGEGVNVTTLTATFNADKESGSVFVRADKPKDET